MKKTSLWLAIIVGLQIAWMGGTAITKEFQLKSGTVVLLETAPVDPRDLLRGDYVILHYKINDLPVSFFPLMPTNSESASAALAGRTVYVVLEPHGPFHEAVSAGFGMPRVTGKQVVIQGTVTPERWRWRSNVVYVNYGIERYYVPEGTGNPRGKLTASISLSGNGSALIKEVFVDSKPYAEAMRNQKN